MACLLAALNSLVVTHCVLKIVMLKAAETERQVDRILRYIFFFHVGFHGLNLQDRYSHSLQTECLV